MGKTRPWRWLAAIAVVCALAALTTAAVTRRRCSCPRTTEGVDLVSARHRLSTDRFYLAATSYERALALQHRASLQSSVSSTLGRLATANGALTSTTVDAFLQGDQHRARCRPAWVASRTRTGRSRGNNNQAAKDISAVSGPCTQLAGGTSAGLVYPFDFPDPDVILVGQTYYAYATNSVAGNIQIIESTDLDPLDRRRQRPAAASLPGPPRLHLGPGGGPDRRERSSCTTPSTWPGSGKRVHLGGDGDPAAGAVRRHVDGAARVPAVARGLHRPDVVHRHERDSYLLWKSGGPGSSKIWSEQLDPSGTSFAPGLIPTQLLVPDQPWEGGTVEAPDLVTTGGRYFLFFSGNDWGSANYAVGVATCAGPLGPCTNSSSQPLLASGAGVDGPGGESVFADATGSYWIAFDGYIPGAVGYPNSRDLFLRRLDLSGPAPIVEESG